MLRRTSLQSGGRRSCVRAPEGLAAGVRASEAPGPRGSSARAAGPRRLALLAIVLSLAAARTAPAAPLLSEIFYDAVGSDNGLSFIELWGEPGTPLGGLVLDGVNGADGSTTPHLTLSGVIPASGLFVIADDAGGGATLVSGADLVLNFDLQNGPDSVVLRSAAGVLDAVGYGEFAAGEVFAGEGAPAVDGAPGTSLARRFANVDTGDNARDFVVLEAPTPGAAPIAAVPEPATAGLVAAGLAGLARGGRRRPAAGRRA